MYSYNIELEAVFKQMGVFELDPLHSLLGGDAALLHHQGDDGLAVGAELGAVLKVGIRLAARAGQLSA